MGVERQVRGIHRDVVLQKRANPPVAVPHYRLSPIPHHSVMHHQQIRTLGTRQLYASQREINSGRDTLNTPTVLQLKTVVRVGVIGYVRSV
jgi:hypothetical protein